MSLDPPMSDAEILALAAKRGAKIDLLPSDEDLARRAAQGRRITCQTTSEPEKKPRSERRATPRVRGAVTLGRLERHLEGGQIIGITATVYGAPRTKKNATSGGLWLSTPGYKHWCHGIVAGFLPERVRLPEAALNLEAHFYVDQKGVPADLVGLLQGMCDALQAAKVVADDNWIRGFDGSRIHYMDLNHPRCEFELCPLKEFRGAQNP